MPRANGPYRQWERSMKRIEKVKAKTENVGEDNIPKLIECGVCGLGVPNMKKHFQWHLENTPIKDWPEPEERNGKEETTHSENE